MNRMNRKLEYALMALKHMSNKTPGQLTSAKEVVEATGSPFDATARVMQVMAQKGILKSEQGAQGGYLIVRDLSKVSVLDLIESLLGPLGVAKCLHGDAKCELFSTCNILSPVALLNKKLMDFYKTLHVAELIKGKDAPQKSSIFQDERAS